MTKSTITRERAQQIFLGNGPEPSASEERELARIALAAMDSEPVAYISKSDFDAGYPHILARRDFNKACTLPVYAAQPAPVVPDAIPVSRDIDAGYLSGWNDCRAAMLQNGTLTNEGTSLQDNHSVDDTEKVNSPVIPDGSVAMLRRWLAFGRGMQNAGCQLPHNLIAETESMLAAAPQPQNAPQNIPEIIPNELIAAVNRLLDSNGSRGCYSAIKCYDAHIEVERLLAAARQEVSHG